MIEYLIIPDKSATHVIWVRISSWTSSNVHLRSWYRWRCQWPLTCGWCRQGVNAILSISKYHRGAIVYPAPPVIWHITANYLCKLDLSTLQHPHNTCIYSHTVPWVYRHKISPSNSPNIIANTKDKDKYIACKSVVGDWSIRRPSGGPTSLRHATWPTTMYSCK